MKKILITGSSSFLGSHCVKNFKALGWHVDGPGQSTDYPMTNLLSLVKQSPDQLTVWGTGEQTRDFVHIDDIVKVINWAITDITKYFTVNIGSGQSTSFLELIDLIYQIMYQRKCPQITRLLDKPMGVQHRLTDVTLLGSLGLLPAISLQQGILTLL